MKEESFDVWLPLHLYTLSPFNSMNCKVLCILKKSLCQSIAEEKHGNYLTILYNTRFVQMKKKPKQPPFLPPCKNNWVEASGSYFLSTAAAIIQTSSVFYQVVFNYLAFMSPVKFFTSRITVLPFILNIDSEGKLLNLSMVLYGLHHHGIWETQS